MGVSTEAQAAIILKFIAGAGVYGQAEFCRRVTALATGVVRRTSPPSTKGFVVLLALCLAACVGGPTRTDIYFGEVKPKSGTCDAPRPASLTVRGDKVQFAPTQGALLLNGTVASGGAITASLTLLDMNKKPARYTLSAQRAGDSIDGTYMTPRCRSTISLTRQ